MQATSQRSKAILIALAVTALAVIAPVLLLPAHAGPAPTLSIYVNSPADFLDANPGNGVCETANGNGVCTLRAAVQEANAHAGYDIIYLQPNTTYVLARVGDDDTNLNGDLDIAEIVGIVGSSGGSAVIQGIGGGTGDRAFDVLTTTVAFMSGVTIRGGKAGFGGGVLVRGMLWLENSIVVSNTASAGGGIYNRGTLLLLSSAVMSNTSSNWGGGIYNEFSAFVYSSTLGANAAVIGGGIASYGPLTVTNSTINRNTVTSKGGGIHVGSGAAALVNSTISGNRANGNGGGLHLESFGASAELSNVTVAFNRSDADATYTETGGGGIFQSQGTISIRHSIIANNINATAFNVSAADCAGTINSADYNLILRTAGCTFVGATANNKTGVDPLLSPLRNNGGPTETHALLAGSPAIDAGNPGGCTGLLGAPLATDQRGVPRAVDGDRNGNARCDMGAFEFLPGTYLPVVAR